MPTKYLYSERVYNEFLDVSKEIKADTYWELNRKVKEQLANWREKEEKKRKKPRNKDLEYQTEQDTIEAIQKIDKYKNILTDSLKVNHFIDLNSLKRTFEFKEFSFREEPPTLEEINEEIGVPMKDSKKEFFLKSAYNKRIKLENEAKRLFEERKKIYDEKKEKAKEKYNEEKLNFISGIKSYNDTIDELKHNLEKGEEKAVERYVNLVLEKSIYPYEIRKQYEVQYDPSNETVIISCELPTKEEVPNITQYRYVSERKEILDIRMNSNEFDEYYEDILYKICLRNIYEIFDALKIEQLKAIVFNGWITYIDETRGEDYRRCIMSVQALRNEFSKLDLAKTEPKKCFKLLKGISVDPLHEKASVRPILDLNENDLRFIQSKEVLESLDDEINLLEIPLGEFEHLIRKLFEKVFSKDKCDIKVTKDSGEDGMDILAFDKDPIRGGKFVIEVRRYNEGVPTSAIINLYERILLEGANKGILITTNDIREESLEFSKDKRITLIGGEELVDLLKEYGYNANIKLKSKNA